MDSIAKELVAEMGAALIGRNIDTIPFGAWPGGVAKVTALTPDPKAPEIVMQVEHSDGRTGSIGVFEDEPVQLVP